MTSMWASRARPESASGYCRHCGGKLSFDEKHWEFICPRCIASAEACQGVALEQIRPGGLQAALEALEACYRGASYPGAPATVGALRRARALLQSYGRLEKVSPRRGGA